jgi:glucose-1-phosphate cytidylyltransferase
MKVVIFAGGYGTRLSEETVTLPKPLVEIGSMPMLWHIMKIYSAYGLNDFVVCCGYKGHLIKKYFLDFFHHSSDLTIDLSDNSVTVERAASEPWRITLADTGLETMTGGRLRRVRRYLGEETFCLTYGDGVSDVDIAALIAFHRAQGTLATVTAVQQPCL